MWTEQSQTESRLRTVWSQWGKKIWTKSTLNLNSLEDTRHLFFLLMSYFWHVYSESSIKHSTPMHSLLQTSRANSLLMSTAGTNKSAWTSFWVMQEKQQWWFSDLLNHTWCWQHITTRLFRVGSGSLHSATCKVCDKSGETQNGNLFILKCHKNSINYEA